MAPRLLLFALLGAILLLAGCSKSTEERLQGAWATDMTVFANSDRVGEQDKAMAQTLFGGGSMEIEFLPEGMFVMRGRLMGKAANRSGRWQMVSEDETGGFIVRTTLEKGGVQSTAFRWQDNDTIVTSDGDEEVVYKRKPAEP